jgi:IclR family transcriptional regulator, acetate operon repressor
MLSTDAAGPSLTPTDEPDDATSSVGKALSILEALATTDHGTLGVSAIARRAHLPKSTAHRLLKILEGQQLVDRSSMNYRLGPRFFELSYAARWSIFGELRELAVPVLEDLFDRIRETVHLAVLEGRDVLYLEKICAPGGSRVPSRVGARMPATCTALGKALLAFTPAKNWTEGWSRALDRVTQYSITDRRTLVDELERARREGVAYDFEEARIGLHCVAAPIRGTDGVAMAAISVAGPSFRFKVETATTPVRRAAEAIELLVCERGVSLPSAGAGALSS